MTFSFASLDVIQLLSIKITFDEREGKLKRKETSEKFAEAMRPPFTRVDRTASGAGPADVPNTESVDQGYPASNASVTGDEGGTHKRSEAKLVGGIQAMPP